MSVATFTKNGTKASSNAKLDKAIFDVKVDNHELLKQAYVAYLSNARMSAAKTKTRGEVSGGGKKPWKQKGTGRARFGSIRVPIWRGGGIALGPTGEENYTQKINLKAKRLATRQALSLAKEASKIIVIEELAYGDKTNEAHKYLTKIGVKAGNNSVLVVANKSEELTRPIQNIRGINIVQARYLNVFDILNADHLVLTEDSLKIISEWLGGEK